MPETQNTLIISGGGLAGAMTALSLSRHLGNSYEIVQIVDTPPDEDLFYGSVTAPSAYDFLRTLGLDEPRLFRSSTTSFSYGTQYQNWLGCPTWVQSHEQPFPVIDDIPLQHHLARCDRPLHSVLIAAQSAQNGRFAHPPQDPNSPLSRAEYGYQFSVNDWRDMLDTLIGQSPVKRIVAEISKVETDDGRISHLQLDTGETVTGSLFIDCTGPRRICISALGASFVTTRALAAWSTVRPTPQLGPSCRTVFATQTGWSAVTHLQGSEHELRVADPQMVSDTSAAATLTLGQLDQAWHGNCVAVGHAASVLEPLTPAPMILLQRDIERLLELVPATDELHVERREFNRRFRADVTHTALFANLFFLSGNLPNNPYWAAAHDAAKSDLLERKRALFRHRGVLLKYDLEPFNDEDWMILFHGLGHRPEHYDVQLDGHPEAKSAAHLSNMQTAISATVSRMPPHAIYVSKMKSYFEKQNYV